MISSDFESSEVVQDPTFRPTDTIEHSLMSVTARRCKQPKTERQHNKNLQFYGKNRHLLYIINLSDLYKKQNFWKITATQEEVKRDWRLHDCQSKTLL